MGYAASTRVKTTGVLIEKLRRESSRLSQVQDLAGARIVLSDRRQQDEAVERITTFFIERCQKPCEVKDRRVEPSHGYRAVHVIVFTDGIPVEIQVRTELQDVWAQILERLADHWGRGIRYGEEPESPGAIVRVGGRRETRREMLDSLGKLGELIDVLEVLRLDAYGFEDQFRNLAETVIELQAVLPEAGSEEGRGAELGHDVWDELVTAYRESMRVLGQEPVVPFPPGTVEAVQRVLASLREADQAGRKFGDQTDKVEADVRRILSEFALAAEEVSVER